MKRLVFVTQNFNNEKRYLQMMGTSENYVPSDLVISFLVIYSMETCIEEATINL